MTKANKQIPIYRIEQKNPDRSLKSVGVNLCLLQCNFIVMDRRGRRSLQGEIKLPYENLPLPSFLFFRHLLIIRHGEIDDKTVAARAFGALQLEVGVIDRSADVRCDRVTVLIEKVAVGDQLVTHLAR